MDNRGKARFLAGLVLDAVKNDEDVEKAIEEGLKELERGEVGSGSSGV